jgi:hypothetical protein
MTFVFLLSWHSDQCITRCKDTNSEKEENLITCRRGCSAFIEGACIVLGHKASHVRVVTPGKWGKTTNTRTGGGGRACMVRGRIKEERERERVKVMHGPFELA